MNLEVEQQQFDDFDHLRERLWGWDTEPIQLSAGPLRLSWDRLSLQDLTIARLRANRVIADRMAIDVGKLVFVVCLAPKKFCGIEVPPGSLVVFVPGREYRSVLDQGWESLEFTISQALLESLGLPGADYAWGRLVPERSVFPLPGPLVAAFRDLAAEISALPSQTSQRPDVGLYVAAVQERALFLLSAALRRVPGRPPAGATPDRVAGFDLAMRAMDYIDHCADQRLSVPEVARAMGVTTRVLQYATQSALGIGPSRYMLARRLHRVRSNLLDRNDGDDTVTQIATDADFFHLSRFSQHYRRLFGELPSETLRRSRAAA